MHGTAHVGDGSTQNSINGTRYRTGGGGCNGQNSMYGTRHRRGVGVMDRTACMIRDTGGGGGNEENSRYDTR